MLSLISESLPLTVGNLPRKVHVGPGSWSLLLFCLNWLGMSKDRSVSEKERKLIFLCHASSDCILIYLYTPKWLGLQSFVHFVMGANTNGEKFAAAMVLLDHKISEKEKNAVPFFDLLCVVIHQQQLSYQEMDQTSEILSHISGSWLHSEVFRQKLMWQHWQSHFWKESKDKHKAVSIN